ncbi:MAG: response regulator transcription factor [Chloroflexota bacterium]
MLEKPSVLIVDDVSENLALLFSRLRDEEFRVLAAESGYNAIEQLQYVHPDVILLDVLMPGLDGYQTCQRIKQDPATADIPIIFLTALDDVVDMVRGFQVGGVDYIIKPIQVEEVIARVNTHTMLSRLQIEVKRQNEVLEERVEERTAQLMQEIEQRKKHEAEKDKLLNILGNQSDQLREMTQWLIGSQKQRHYQKFTTLQEEISHNLTQIESHLQMHHTLLANEETSASFGESADEHISSVHLQDALSLLKHTHDYLQDSAMNLDFLSVEEESVLAGPLLALTAREREVLQLIVDGKSYGDIAELLYLSETTVRTHRSRIMQKLGIDDLPSLVKFSIRIGLSTLD